MKNLQNNFTTPEQSERLLELGLPADSADITITKHTHYNHLSHTNHSYWEHTMINFKGNPDAETYLPCWSVGRLREIFCICSSVNGGREYPFCNSQVAWWITEFEFKKEFIDFSRLEQ